MTVDWEKVRRTCWQVFKPALVAMIVALLTTLGYLGLEQSRQPVVGVAGTTHFTSLSTTDDVAVGDDLTVAGDATIDGALTSSGGYAYSGEVSGTGVKSSSNLTGTSSSGLLRYAKGIFTTTLDAQTISTTLAVTIGNGTSGTLAVGGASGLSGTVTAGDDLDVAGQMDGANGLELTNGMTMTSGTALLANLYVSGTTTMAGGYTWTGELSAPAGLLLGGNVTQTSSSGSALFGNAVVSGTADLRGVVSSNGSNMLRIDEDVVTTGTLTTSGAGSFGDTLDVTGIGTFESYAAMQNGALVVNGITMTSGTGKFEAASITTTLSVAGQAALANGALVGNGITMTSGTAMIEAASITTTASVGGLATLSNGLKVSGGISNSGSILDTSGAGTITINAAVVTTTLSVGGQATFSNGAVVGGNVTQTTGSAIWEHATISDTLGVAGQTTLSNGLLVTGITQTSGSALLNSLAVTSTATANTFQASDNVTVTHNLTVSGWVGLGGTYFGVSSTVDYTDTETLIVVAGKSIYPVTPGGPTATLSDTVSISDGFYLGQVIYVSNVDTLAHSLVIKNAANTSFGAAGDVTLAYGLTYSFWWDGSNWRLLGLTS